MSKNLSAPPAREAFDADGGDKAEQDKTIAEIQKAAAGV